MNALEQKMADVKISSQKQKLLRKKLTSKLISIVVDVCIARKNSRNNARRIGFQIYTSLKATIKSLEESKQTITNHEEYLRIRKELVAVLDELGADSCIDGCNVHERLENCAFLKIKNVLWIKDAVAILDECHKSCVVEGEPATLFYKFCMDMVF
jgi:hypothetical protein